MEFMMVATMLLFGLASSAIARSKGRGELRWFVLGFIFQFFGLIVFVLPPVCRPGMMKRCQGCAEIIKDQASVCRYCGRTQVEVA